MGYPGVSLGNKTDPNDRMKKTKMAAVSWVFQSRWFSTKTTRVFQRRSLLVYLCRFCRQRKVKTVSSCGAHFRSGDNIFSVQIATKTVCITRKMHLYRYLSRFLGRSLDFSSVWEGSWFWACGWGYIVWGGGGWLTNFKWLLACIGYRPAPQEGT